MANAAGGIQKYIFPSQEMDNEKNINFAPSYKVYRLE